MKLEELNVYKLSMDLGEKIWSIVDKWNKFEKDTIGQQLVRSVDSIATNISEGYGRYHYNESKHFVYYSRGSLYETKTWITKAFNRDLIDNEIFSQLENEINTFAVKLNNYINSIGKKSTTKMTTNDYRMTINNY